MHPSQTVYNVMPFKINCKHFKMHVITLRSFWEKLHGNISTVFSMVLKAQHAGCVQKVTINLGRHIYQEQSAEIYFFYFYLFIYFILFFFFFFFWLDV